MLLFVYNLIGIRVAVSEVVFSQMHRDRHTEYYSVNRHV